MFTVHGGGGGAMIEQRTCIGTVGYMGGIPALLEPFVWSLTQMIQFNTEALCGAGEYVHYIHTGKSLHASARTHLASQTRGEWLLMLDTDMTFDPDLCARLVRLMHKYSVEVVSGIYPYKSMPMFPVAYVWNDHTNRHEVVGDWPDAELFEVSSIGAGCLLIRKRTLERIVTELHEDPFEIIPPYGEDHSFFMRLKRLGVKGYCAPHVEAGHIALQPLFINPGAAPFDIPRANQYSVEAFGMAD
jgi:Glycosyl transferase family 2